MSERPPQWLFDEIAKLPSDARGWALGFMLAGWLAGCEIESIDSKVVVNLGDDRIVRCDRCGCVFPASVTITEPKCIHTHDGKTCGSGYSVIPHRPEA